MHLSAIRCETRIPGRPPRSPTKPVWCLRGPPQVGSGAARDGELATKIEHLKGDRAARGGGTAAAKAHLGAAPALRGRRGARALLRSSPTLPGGLPLWQRTGLRGRFREPAAERQYFPRRARAISLGTPIHFIREQCSKSSSSPSSILFQIDSNHSDN